MFMILTIVVGDGGQIMSSFPCLLAPSDLSAAAGVKYIISRRERCLVVSKHSGRPVAQCWRRR